MTFVPLEFIFFCPQSHHDNKYQTRVPGYFMALYMSLLFVMKRTKCFDFPENSKCDNSSVSIVWNCKKPEVTDNSISRSLP